VGTVERADRTSESAADYPTPPAYEQVDTHVRVEVGGVVIADTRRAVVARQTGIAPVFYIPRDDIRMNRLVPSTRTSHCPYKGDAVYFAVEVDGHRFGAAGWSYPDPLPEASAIANAIAFYAHVVDATVDGARAAAPDWKWVGGWVLPWTLGPFKGPEGAADAAVVRHAGSTRAG
jgi:uncharacterized protein (DUF427 family)